MLTATYLSPVIIHSNIKAYGVRHTFWFLTEQCSCSVTRAIYLILLSI